MSPRPAAAPGFRFDTGRLCLDLVATVGARLSGAPVERMTDPARLALWLRMTELLDATETGAVDESWVEAFVELRGVLHRLVHARLKDREPEAADLALLNAAAAHLRRPRELYVERRDGHDDVPRSWATRVHGPAVVTAALAAVAADAVDLLGGPDADRLHECEGSTCDLVYVDSSRAQQRRWCSSGACGNRSRVAHHRRRRSEGS